MYYSDIATQHFFHEVQNKQIKLPHLTAMEIRVIKECCGDLNYGQIGKKIGKTQKSVEGCRDSLFKKLKVNSRASLVMFAVQFGFVPLEIVSAEDPNFLNKKTEK